SLSRELAATGIRQCRGNPSSACLQNILDKVRQVGEAQLDGVKLGVSLWRWDNSDPLSPSCIQISTGATGGFTSRYDSSDFESATLSQACRDFQDFAFPGGPAEGSASIAIGESQFRFEPVISRMGPLFGLNQKDLYVVTIF
ncbi:MAG: hypothetical protein DCC75_13875, partial [Proteobacteria bacterium]